MAYNESSAERIRKQMKKNPGFVEKKMFGGICFLLNGNMAGGIEGVVEHPLGGNSLFSFFIHVF